MSSLLYTLEGWPNSPAADNVARKFDNDNLTWSTAVAASPFTGQVVSTSVGQRQKGGWDGNRWYVIGPDGKLYAYSPGPNTWSAALGAGVVLIGGTVEDQHWTMCSDGRFVYLLDSNAGFRRYDPVADTLTGLASVPGNSATGRMLLDFDGNDTLYGFRGGTDAPHQLAKFTISTGVWTVLPSQATLNNDLANVNTPVWSAFLQGKWWVFEFFANDVKAFQYDPSGNAWTAKAALTGQVINGLTFAAPFGERTDSSIRLWMTTAATATLDYSTGADTWSRDTNAPVNFNQGGNWAVTRTFTPDYLWLAADGVTPTSPTVGQGTFAAGEVANFHYTIKTPVARAGGATVSVVSTPLTDAEDCVTICQTANGTFGTTFTTAALNPNDVFDVFVRLSPTRAQSLGFTKLYTLKVV
jgi:hypothetical protein